MAAILPAVCCAISKQTTTKQTSRLVTVFIVLQMDVFRRLCCRFGIVSNGCPYIYDPRYKENIYSDGPFSLFIRISFVLVHKSSDTLLVLSVPGRGLYPEWQYCGESHIRYQWQLPYFDMPVTWEINYDCHFVYSVFTGLFF